MQYNIQLITIFSFFDIMNKLEFKISSIDYLFSKFISQHFFNTFFIKFFSKIGIFIYSKLFQMFFLFIEFNNLFNMFSENFIFS